MRYHATAVLPAERNAYMRFHSTINRTIVRSIEVYSEPHAVRESGLSYCARPGMGKSTQCCVAGDFWAMSTDCGL